jgi:hypothetical protein
VAFGTSSFRNGQLTWLVGANKHIPPVFCQPSLRRYLTLGHGILLSCFELSSQLAIGMGPLMIDGLVKIPSAALRFNFVVAACVSTLHPSVFARLASGAIYETIDLVTFYKIIMIHYF